MTARVDPGSSRLLRPDEVAARLGVKLSTLAAWRCTGNNAGLPFVKMGRSVRYSPADVEAFIAESRRAPGAA